MNDDSSPDKDAEDLAIENDENVVSNSSHPIKPAHFQSGGQLDFNFVAYDEKIVIVGASGSGKTYLANQIMKGLNGITVWVFDPNYQFHSSRAMVFNDLSEMLKVYDSAKRGHYILQPHQNDENTFRRFCSEGFKRGNLVLIMDEAHSFLTKQKQLKEFNNIILSGRPRGISCVTLSSRPSSLPNNVLSNAKHVFSFKLNLESDVKFLEGYLGEDVWILMPKDKRHKLKDEAELPEHTFFYRDMDKDRGVIGKV